MSIEALKWALDIGEELNLEPPRRLVLIMLGNSADPAGAHLFPSHGFISRRTGLAVSTVRAHVAALQKTGLLIKEPRHREDHGQTSNNYHLAMRQPGLGLEDTPLPESSRGGALASRPPASQPAGGGDNSKVLKQEGDSRRGTRLPADWTPTPELLAWAHAERPDLDHRKMLERFRDHWIAQPGQRGTKLDWPATYRNWVRGEKRAIGAPVPARTAPERRCARGAACLERGPLQGYTRMTIGDVCNACRRAYLDGKWKEQRHEARA